MDPYYFVEKVGKFFFFEDVKPLRLVFDVSQKKIQYIFDYLHEKFSDDTQQNSKQEETKSENVKNPEVNCPYSPSDGFAIESPLSTANTDNGFSIESQRGSLNSDEEKQDGAFCGREIEYTLFEGGNQLKTGDFDEEAPYN